MRKIALAFLLLLLTACASNTIKTSAVDIKNKPIVVIPVGKIKYEVVSDRVGSNFGLLGVLVEHAVTSSSRGETEGRLQSAIPPEYLVEITKKQIANQLSAQKYNIHSIENRKDDGVEFSTWFNDEGNASYKVDDSYKGKLVLQFGFSYVTVKKSIGDAKGGFGLAMRLVEGGTGKVIGKTFVYLNEYLKINIEEDNPNYSQELKNGFEFVATRGVQEAIRKMVSN